MNTTPKKTDAAPKTNRPIVDAFKAIETADSKNLSARLKSFTLLREAGATIETLGAKGAHFADLKEGVALGWQGAAFWSTFDVTSDGKASIMGKVVDRFGGATSERREKNDWARDLSGKVSKVRKAYGAWLDDVTAAEKAAADAVAAAEAAKAAIKAAAAAKSAGDDQVSEDAAILAVAKAESAAAIAAAAAASAGSGTRNKKTMKERVLDDIKALRNAVDKDKTSDKSDGTLQGSQHVELINAFDIVLGLLGKTVNK